MKENAVKSKATKIVNYILNALICLFTFILFLILLLNFQTVFLGEKYNSFFGYSFFEVETGSMEPTIQIGDWIITKAQREYDLDDIITFEEENAFVTHRVTQVCEDTYVTKGDSNNTRDESITRDQIVGKVVKILPRVGIMKKVLLNPKFIIGFIVLLLILCTIIDDGKKSILKDILGKFDSSGGTKEKEEKKEEKVPKEEKINVKKEEKKIEIPEEIDEDVEFAKNVFSTMKIQDENDSKTEILSTIDVNLDIPELKKKNVESKKEPKKEKKQEESKEEIV